MEKQYLIEELEYQGFSEAQQEEILKRTGWNLDKLLEEAEEGRVLPLGHKDLFKAILEFYGDPSYESNVLLNGVRQGILSQDKVEHYHRSSGQFVYIVDEYFYTECKELMDECFDEPEAVKNETMRWRVKELVKDYYREGYSQRDVDEYMIMAEDPEEEEDC